MYAQHRIAVVIPAHNEARLLPETIATLPEWVDDVIVVDDGSDDGTGGLAAQTGVEVITHTENQGVGAAISTGYARALELGVDVTVVVGADRQMDPAEMNRLVDPVVHDLCDYAKGDRMGHPEVRHRMPSIRYLGNLCLTVMTRWATGYDQLSDAQCGYTAINAKTLARIDLGTLYPRYGFPNDLLAKLAGARARVLDRPVSPIYGDEQSELKVSRVMGPILGILLRAGIARLRRWRRGHHMSLNERPHEAS